MPQNPLELFKLASPKPTHSALLVLSCGKHNRGTCPQSLSPLCLLIRCGASLHGSLRVHENGE